VDEGRIPITATVQGHWDLCLQCRACEAVCPSGVAYGRIIEHVKAQVAERPASGQAPSRLRRFLLRNVIAKRRVLALACIPLRLAAGGPVRALVDRIRLPGRAGRLLASAASMPRRQGKPFRAGELVSIAPGKPAVLFTGCVMSELFGNVHRATARVLQRGGFAPSAPSTQGCCGALHAHDGDLDFARKLARANIDGLEGPADVPVVVNSAGCGAAMKEYGQLLAHDPDYVTRAAQFSARVRDFSEVLPPGTGAMTRPIRAAYQDACHLAHAQRIHQQPRSLLASAAGLEMVDTAGADMCCGAAGIYSLVQPEMSAELRARKAEQFGIHRPDVVVTANPGCQMQYEAAVRDAGIRARVLHLAELLDEAHWSATTPVEGATPPT
jgi:glycolate oxidase iron-sulfur subunit